MPGLPTLGEQGNLKVNVKNVVAACNGEAYERMRDGYQDLTLNIVRIETVNSQLSLRTYVTSPLFAELRLEEGKGACSQAASMKGCGSFCCNSSRNSPMARPKRYRC